MKREEEPDLKSRLFCVSLCAAILAFTGACAGKQEPGSKTPEQARAGVADKQAADPEVFKCSSAGRWYPADPATLRNMLEEELKKAKLDTANAKIIKGKILALISPHAGFQYSAPVAAYSYAPIEGMRYDVVAVVGFSHSLGDSLVGVYPSGAFETPLGRIPIDEDAARAFIASSPLIHENKALFVGEHSLDNQLPFLQSTLKNFKLLPVIIGTQSPENIEAVAKGLAAALKNKNALIVASTDMSHFWKYDEANKLDAEVAGLIKNYDIDGISKIMSSDGTGRRLCGHGVVQAVLKAAKLLGGDRTELLRYANSQDTYGPTGNGGVVGYGAFAIVDDNPAAKEEKMGADNTATGGELSSADRKEMLSIARASLESYVKNGKRISGASDNRALKIKRGMFVTLNINGRLRGCMGHFENDTPIDELVASQTLVSATRDPRFPEVSAGEIENIDIEISILSVPQPVDSYEDIVVGKHGVILEKNGYGATFLPQVAPEQGWDRDTMLTQLSLKAGLPGDAWKKGAKFRVYTAEIFGEKEKH